MFVCLFYIHINCHLSLAPLTLMGQNDEIWKTLVILVAYILYSMLYRHSAIQMWQNFETGLLFSRYVCAWGGGIELSKHWKDSSYLIFIFYILRIAKEKKISKNVWDLKGFFSPPPLFLHCRGKMFNDWKNESYLLLIIFRYIHNI